MNQYLPLQHFSLSPDLSPLALELTLGKLLVPGVIVDKSIEVSCRQLQKRFGVFAATCPVAEWAPGLQITSEMRRQYEVYLPVDEIRVSLANLCKHACRYEPLATTALAAALSWPEALASLLPLAATVNPAHFLQRLATAEPFRAAFLAALYIPKNFGGSFARYPLQAEFLHRWLAAQKKRLFGRVAIMDAACGSGEGTYAAAATVLQLGFSASASRVTGSTLEPLELAAAAHGWFPHDKTRAAVFRQTVSDLLANGAGRMIHFHQEDLCTPRKNDGVKYDVILCNGLLGGPLLHRQEIISRVIAQLAQRLSSGGILFAADRFHAGWKQLMPSTLMKELLTASGLQCVDIGEGVGAVKTG